jgi:uncharacterized protein YqhQ
MAIAVRRPDGTIVVRRDAWVSIWERLRFLRWPLLRGSVVLVESLYNGIQALNFAAAQAEDEPKTEGEGRSTGGAIALSFVLAIGLFVGLPHLLAWGTGAAAGKDLDVDTFGFHALDGFFKILIFVGYIAGISLIPEIRRVFQYHGAEHKVVNAYENDLELTVENAQRLTTFHARCGTSFVLFVLVLSIFMFAAIFPFIPTVSEIALVNHVAMILVKVPLMLPLSGLAYEINRYAARHPRAFWVQALVLPGRLMQRLTTREPTADQIEIALAAMKAALEREAELAHVGVAEAHRIARGEPQGMVLVYQSYADVARPSEAPLAGH